MAQVSKFEVWKSTKAANQWYFRLESENSKCVAVSEGYESVDACLNGIRSVKRIAAGAIILAKDDKGNWAEVK